MATGPSTLTPFQATYHWRNKNCYPWAAAWFKKELPGLKVEKDGMSAEITEVTEVEGDVDLGQRKGKLLTIYDCRVVMAYKGINDKSEEVTGTVTIPEVSHECIDGLSDYTYEFTGASGSFLSFLRSSYPSIFITKLSEFRPALISANGLSDSNPSSSSSSSGVAGSSSIPERYSPLPPGEVRQKSSNATNEKNGGKSEKGKLNTGSVKVEARLQIAEGDLWGLLTDQSKVPMWSRAPAKISTEKGSEFELFGGNVRGTIVSSNAPKQLVQNWQVRSGDWPADHYGVMTITLDQGSDSTLVTFDLSGVPKGQEETIKGALETYYIRGFKQMGLVMSSSSSVHSSSSPSPSINPSKKSSSGSKPNPKSKPKSSAKPKTKPNKAPSSNSKSMNLSDWVPLGVGIGAVVVFVGLVWNSYPSSGLGR